MIELRWMKLKDASPEVEPVLQWRATMNNGAWSVWARVPLVYTDTPQSETGDTVSQRYGE